MTTNRSKTEDNRRASNSHPEKPSAPAGKEDRDYGYYGDTS